MLSRFECWKLHRGCTIDSLLLFLLLNFFVALCHSWLRRELGAGCAWRTNLPMGCGWSCHWPAAYQLHHRIHVSHFPLSPYVTFLRLFLLSASMPVVDIRRMVSSKRRHFFLSLWLFTFFAFSLCRILTISICTRRPILAVRRNWWVIRIRSFPLLLNLLSVSALASWAYCWSSSSRRCVFHCGDHVA